MQVVLIPPSPPFKASLMARWASMVAGASRLSRPKGSAMS